MCKRVALSVLAFTLVMILLATAALGSQAQPLPDNGGRVDGIYVWSNETGMPEDRQGLVDACTAPAHPLGIVLHSNYLAGGYLSMWPAADLHAFNELAHQAGTSVYALYTNKFWIPKVVQYNSECSGVEQHFDGYAMDYEGPEGSVGWEPSTTSDIQYYADAKAACGALPLHVSIGWHWDNPILYGGQTKPAYEHILDLVDGVDVQTAFETAAEIESRAQQEVGYGAGLNKPVFLTIETQDVSALGMSEWNTFYEEGQDAMWAELAQVDFGGPTFAGFMLHYYEHAYASGAALWPLPDQCPEDPSKTTPGVCGCGVADTDSDGDGTADCSDSTPPVLVNVPGDMAVQATSADGANVSYVAPTATDDVDPSPTVSCAPASGGLFPLGTTTVSCTATDAAGNASSASFQVTVAPATVFVRLLDSQGNGLAGGAAQYYEGGWKTIPGSTDSDGWLITDVPKTKGNLTFRITYASASKDRAQNVGVDPVVVFQTTRVEVQLQDSTEALIDAGAVQYYAGAWRTFGSGSTSGGVASMELLPNSYTFAMTYAYGRNQKAQDVGADPLVVFQTTRVEVQLQDSTEALIDTGAVQYYAGAWRTFGSGSTSGGVVSMELLPNSYTFAMTYAYARNQKAQSVGADPTVVFQTQRVEVQLQDSAGALIDTGAVQYYAGAWRTFGSGSTSGGVASMELLPNSYTFAVTYAYGRNQKAQNVGADPVVVFETTRVEVQLQDSAGALIDTGAVQYYAGAWRTFGSGSTSGGVASMELLPNSYTFAMTYAFGRNQKAQNVGDDPTVVFQTGQVYSLSGTCTHYYAGAWRLFTQGMELLPNAYTFRFSGIPDGLYTISQGVANPIQ